MLSLDLLNTPDFPYIPLPQGAQRAALSSIRKHGFIPLEDFEIISRRENDPIKTNILAFTHAIHRTPDYTGLTVFNAINHHNDNQMVSILATSAAPFHFIHRDGEFSFWVCPVHDQRPAPRLIESHISYDQLDNAFSEYAADLTPQRIIGVKQGYDRFTIFRDVQPLQLSLWASDVTGKLLIQHFAQTVAELRRSLGSQTHIHGAEKDGLVTTLSIQLLGAVILADTGALGNELRTEKPTLDTLMREASERFGRYFKYSLFKEHFYEAEHAYQLLQKICYAGFVPDMLSDLYKTAFSEKERKESGSYDTPLYLTRQIWKNIPVEYLSPQKRIIADMTCGWGSFLVAGHERLSTLKDMDDVFLRDQLHGNDSSDFTAQLAGLGLLLSASEDSWNIRSRDAFEWSWLQTNQPTIIVGNPPFGGDRKKTTEKITPNTEKAREEKANNFLRYAFERLAPGGYLAMIMPRSFTVAEASPSLRQQLLESCDVLELWELPTRVFSGPTQRTLVLFAQKKSERHLHLQTPVRMRTIQPSTLHAFKTEGTFTISEIVPSQGQWNEQSRKSTNSKNTYLMDYFLILSQGAWEKICTHCNKLIDMAEIMRGATEGKKDEKKRWKDYPYPKQVPWFDSVKAVMPSKRPWWLDYTRANTIIYPNNLKEPCKSEKSSEDKESILAGVKVLVPYGSDPSWGKRVRVAIERRGYYVSDHFYVVAPTVAAQEKYISPEVLAAVLDWDVGNAWIIEHLKSPGIPKRAMDTLPFPSDLNEEDCQALTQAVQMLESASASNLQEPKEATEVIDFILKKAYHLDDATFSRLRQVKEWSNTSPVTLDPQPENDESNCLISGVVDHVNTAQRTITLWIKGFSQLQTVPIDPSMPGWMLRPDTAFRTEIPYRYIKYGIIESTTVSWGAFRPQPYTYMSEEELLDGFANLLPENNRDRVG